MAKDPAFLFYTQDFTTGTQFFTDEQVGKYVRLLLAQHQHGHLYEKQMIHICKTHDKDIFAKFKIDSEGLFYNERLERELIKRKEYSKSRSNNRKKRIISESYDSHMENVNEDYIVLVFNCEFEEKEIIKFYAMIVKKMMDTWLNYKPDYEILKEEDYHSLLEIAYTIAERKGWEKKDILSIKQDHLIESWQKVVEWLTGEKQVEYYKTMPLDKVGTRKGFRDIQERMKTTPIVSAIKLKKMELERITPDQYFKDEL
jgi:hypothetical protein